MEDTNNECTYRGIRNKESSSGHSSNEANATMAKDARKRAKERARSMHSRIFKKESYNQSTNNNNTTSKANTGGASQDARGGMIKSRSAHTTRPPFRHLKKKLSDFNVSISSISELEELTFHDSGISGMSSVTHDASWNTSLTFNLDGTTTTTTGSSHHGAVSIRQGPSSFDVKDKGGGMAPKMPLRGESIRGLSVGHNSSSTGMHLDPALQSRVPDPPVVAENTLGDNACPSSDISIKSSESSGCSFGSCSSRSTLTLDSFALHKVKRLQVQPSQQCETPELDHPRHDGEDEKEEEESMTIPLDECHPVRATSPPRMPSRQLSNSSIDAASEQPYIQV